MKMLMQLSRSPFCMLFHNFTFYRLLSEDKKMLALSALKHKRQQEELLNRAEEYLLQVNQVISNVEMAAVQNDVVRALESGKLALSALQAEVSAEYVEKLLTETADLSENVGEINALLANAQREDESLFAEYKILEDQVFQEKIQAMPNVPKQQIQAPRELSEEVILEHS